jgi:hypothetical protein
MCQKRNPQHRHRGGGVDLGQLGTHLDLGMVLRELVAAALVLQPPLPSRRAKAVGRRVVLGSQQERRGHGKAEAGKRRTQAEEACLSAAFLVRTDG